MIAWLKWTHGWYEGVNVYFLNNWHKSLRGHAIYPSMHSSIFLNIYPVKGCGDSGAYLSTNGEFSEFTITPV